MNFDNNFFFSKINKICFLNGDLRTGKSNLLFEKCTFLFEKKNFDIKKDEILFLSFNSVYYNNINNNILNSKYKNNINFFVFDDFILNLVNIYQKKISLIDKNFKLISNSDRLLFLLENLVEFNLQKVNIKNNKFQIANQLNDIILNLKFNSISISGLEKEEFGDISEKVDIFAVFSAYEQFKKKNNFLDITDLYLNFNVLLNNNNDILNEVKSMFRYIIVDDFENISKLQFDFLKLIINNFNISISYNKNFNINLRDKRFDFKKLFEDFYGDLEDFNLNKVNFNSIGNINLLNKLNKNLFNQDDYLLLNKTNGFEFNKNYLVKYSNSDLKISYIIERIQELNKNKNIKNSDINPGMDIGIILDNNQDFNFIVNALNNLGIGYNINFDYNLSKFDVIIELVYLLKVIDNPKESNIELFYLLEKLDLKYELLRKISRKSSLSEKSIYNVLVTNNSISDLDSENLILNNFIKNINLLIEMKNNKISIYNLVYEIISKFDYYYKLTINNDFQSINALNIFLDYTFDYVKKYRKNNLSFFVERVNLMVEYNIDFKLLNSNYVSNSIKVNNSNYNNKNKTNGDKDSINSNLNINIFNFNHNLTNVSYLRNLSFDYLFILDLNDSSFLNTFQKNIYSNNYLISEYDFDLSKKRLFYFLVSRSKLSVEILLNTISSQSSFIDSSFLENFDLNEINLDNLSFTNTFGLKFKVKQELISKINNYLLSDNYDLALNQMNLYKKLFEKNVGLNNFINNNNNNFSEDEYNYYIKLLNDGVVNNIKNSFFEIFTNKTFDYSWLDMTKQVYSVSQLKTYQSCPKKYLYQYVYKVPTTARHYFDFGTSVHEVLEHLVDDINPEISKDMIFAKAVNMLHKVWISKGYINAIQEREYFEKGVIAIRDFIERELKIREDQNSRIILGKEKVFNITILGKKIYGIIDRVDKLGDGNLEILDYKTSNSCENITQLNNSIQLFVYSMAIKELYGKYPKKIGLWYLIHDKISSINFTKDKLDRVKKEILSLIEGVESKNFESKPSKFACTYCDFNKICTNSYLKKND